MLWINLNKCLFYFFDSVWFDRHTPANILICFICIYFLLSLSSLFSWSGVFISASFEGYVVFFAFCLCSCSLWPECFQQICLVTSVQILICNHSFISPKILSLAAICHQTCWLIDKAAYNYMIESPRDSGTPPQEPGRRSVVAHFDLLNQTRRMQGGLIRNFGLYTGVRGYRHIDLLLQL